MPRILERKMTFFFIFVPFFWIGNTFELTCSCGDLGSIPSTFRGTQSMAKDLQSRQTFLGIN
jgi:hypothetical protein